MVKPRRFDVRDSDVTHVVIELFGGDNNLSRFVVEDLREMASGTRGNFATLALTDVEELPDRSSSCRHGRDTESWRSSAKSTPGIHAFSATSSRARWSHTHGLELPWDSGTMGRGVRRAPPEWVRPQKTESGSRLSPRRSARECRSAHMAPCSPLHPGLCVHN